MAFFVNLAIFEQLDQVYYEQLGKFFHITQIHVNNRIKLFYHFALLAA